MSGTGVRLTGGDLGGGRSALPGTTLCSQRDVIQTPRLQVLDVGGVSLRREGHLLDPPHPVIGGDGQEVSVDRALGRPPLDHSGGGGGLYHPEVGGAGGSWPGRRRRMRWRVVRPSLTSHTKETGVLQGTN